MLTFGLCGEGHWAADTGAGLERGGTVSSGAAGSPSPGCAVVVGALPSDPAMRRRYSLRHGSILSRVGAFGKHGTVQLGREPPACLHRGSSVPTVDPPYAPAPETGTSYGRPAPSGYSSAVAIGFQVDAATPANPPLVSS